MYVQGEYNDDWEWAGDEESLLDMFRVRSAQFLSRATPAKK
jgi:hypothetical protein